MYAVHTRLDCAKHVLLAHMVHTPPQTLLAVMTDIAQQPPLGGCPPIVAADNCMDLGGLLCLHAVVGPLDRSRP